MKLCLVGRKSYMCAGASEKGEEGEDSTMDIIF